MRFIFCILYCVCLGSLHADAPVQKYLPVKELHYTSPVPEFPRSHEPLTEEQKRLRERLLDQALIEFGQEAFWAEIHAYIQMILDDGILQDPDSYLNAWTKARGITREYRMPEDPARWFFYRQFLHQ